MNILITGAWQQAGEYIEQIEALGHKTVFLQWEKNPLPCDPEWVEGIICNGFFLYHPIEQFVNLKYIQLTSAGFDRVPMEYIEKHGIEIHNAKNVYSIPMAEFALAGVLSLYKQLPFFYENQKQHRWEKHRSLLELAGKRVLILGCGSVGKECAKRFEAFGCDVVGVNHRIRPDEVFSNMIGFDQLDEELKKADILVLALPLTEETYHFISEKRIASMKNTAILVNVARGAIVDQSALERALEGEQLGGAVLDVFEEEPLPEESRLWELENVIVTPHNSFVGERNPERINSCIVRNLEKSIAL
ncbi:MAG: D-2-hydroxyacid dehydrogenase [Lachnospiraceae bacterium]|nr:D-2-hydroxyacid dehydrogenase [Lachnospiraceae bacterium]